jgi:tetratricopeptide (TPR) repeat protein
LSVIPSGTTPFADVAGLRLQSLMNRGQYRAAAFVSQSMLRSPNLSAESGYFLQSSLALAEAHLGQEKTALASMERAKELRLKVAAPREEAEDRMVEAEIELSVGNKQDAYNSAEKAYEFFSTHELHESAFRSAILAHAASEMLHRSDDSASSTKIDEQARKLREIWGADVFQVYWSSSPTLSAYTRGTNVL